MKIIKAGKIKGEKHFEYECPFCDTVFECVESDGEVRKDLAGENYLEVECPVCGNACKIDLSIGKE